jgi:hypothetical protein
LAKSATEPESGSLPRSAAGSASAALTCRLSRSTISAGVPSDAEPAGHRESGDHVADRWDVRQHPTGIDSYLPICICPASAPAARAQGAATRSQRHREGP